MTVAQYKSTAPECDIQAGAVAELRLLGYVVLETTTHIRGTNKRSGVTPGIPDLLVSHVEWATGPVWIGVEMKTATGTLTKEQKELFAGGRICVARTVDEAVALVREYEYAMLGRVYGRTGEPR